MTGYGTVFSIQRYCLHDGPGIRTTVFLKGCPLRCVWCHNPESKDPAAQLLFDGEKCTGCGRCVAVCSMGARSICGEGLLLEREKCTACGACVPVCPARANEIKGEVTSVSTVMDEVTKDRLFYEASGGGVTLSGGEPAMQKDFSLALLSCLRDKDIDRAVETSGMGDPEFFENAAALDTLFLYDIKALSDEKHRALCGASNERILSNLDLLFKIGARIILRLPLIPSYNDSPEDLRLLREFLSRHKGKFLHGEIMPHHNLGVAKERRLGIPPLKIESGEDYTEGWLSALSGEGYEIQLSNG